MTPEFNPAAIAARIRENVRLINTRQITWSEFDARQRAAWDSVSLGEQRVINSACDRRHMAVHHALPAVTDL